MAVKFVNVDRDTPMMFPPDLWEWLPEDSMVHFVVDAVEMLDVGSFEVNDRGSGNAQYPPRMMLALLAYCYATGRFSSREIELATHYDVAVRYICGGALHPDHDTICAREDQVEAVSLGEEKPKAEGANEAAWAQNRRGDMLYNGEF